MFYSGCKGRIKFVNVQAFILKMYTLARKSVRFVE